MMATPKERAAYMDNLTSAPENEWMNIDTRSRMHAFMNTGAAQYWYRNRLRERELRLWRQAIKKSGW